MDILARKDKAIDLETLEQIVLCRDREVRGSGPHRCKRKKMFVSDSPDCVVCVQGRAPE